MTDRELMQQALEALEEGLTSKQWRELITALRERLAQPEQHWIDEMAKVPDHVWAQPEQEPVAWADMDVRGEDKGLSWTPGHFHKTPLYTTPLQRKHNNGVIAERQRIVNLLMIQHEAAKGAHNYWHVAAQLIQADVASDT